ncbi:PKD repeat protein [Paenibacillus phyllosphaerae]|uniref:PKD repeat protein n=1 Tax=Paenibacillus phyllosphaerae TaxID=274593 RepID=A0A7W5AUY3_9BACL|nr:stalk domain-containing protein [Paenibacillus phyllosphaerae]MBB3109148.1 PKD repeat protein [Paenibacillus phyllosphaerae]
MKSMKWLLSLALLFVPLGGVINADRAVAVGAASNRLTLQINSKVMDKNGVQSLAAQPVTVKSGTSFIPLKSVANQYGYKVAYDVKTKEAVVTTSLHVFRFKDGRKTITQDGKAVTAPLAPYSQNGSFMVPIRTWSTLTDSKLALTGKTISLTWSTQPTADFSVQPEKIYAGETFVTYVDRSTTTTGTPYVAERWEGKMDVFPQAGTYTITRVVQDSSGVWSDPYSVTIQVLAPNQAPVADFSTEQETYRIGEQVIYTDLSYDDENAIVKRTWSGKEDVFFEAGVKTVQLEVEDSHGLKGTVVKTITVTDEVLYTKNEYDMLFTEQGKKYTINGASVLNYPVISYTYQSNMAQMVRSNSPETLITEGIAYDDMLSGEVSFMFHHLNKIGYPVKIYLLATNKSGVVANVSTGASGIGGPDVYISNTGKLSTARYLQAIADNKAPTVTTIRPNQTVILYQDLNKVPVKPEQTVTAYVDLNSDQELHYQVVVVAADKDPIALLPSLTLMDRYDIHTRGTFYNASRTIDITEPLGSTPSRLVLGDGKNDPYLIGMDAVTGKNEVNVGNFGVMYKMTLNHVAPNTLIALNPRGGHYAGAFLVNGKLVYVTKDSILKDNTEAAVLYRTGSTEESVELVFTIAAGGNLPLAMLFLPMPGLKY